MVCVEGEIAKHDDGRRTVYVFDEKTFERFWLNDRVLDEHHTAPQRAARDFLLAHPLPEPKPWHDAKPGEVWVIDEANHETTAARAGLVNERMKFEPVNNITRHIDVDDTSILGARRIWPEEEA